MAAVELLKGRPGPVVGAAQLRSYGLFALATAPKGVAWPVAFMGVVHGTAGEGEWHAINDRLCEEPQASRTPPPIGYGAAHIIACHKYGEPCSISP